MENCHYFQFQPKCPTTTERPKENAKPGEKLGVCTLKNEFSIQYDR